MEQQNQPEVQQEGAGAGQGAQARSDVNQQTKEITAAYEKAKQEMNDAVARLRQEVDRIDVDRARQQAQDWVKDNPALAAFLAIGAGVVLGKALSSALRPAPPPPLPARLRNKALDYASFAKEYAEDIGEAILAGAAIAGGAVATTAAGASGKIARQAAEWGEAITETAEDVTDVVRHRAGRAAKGMQSDAQDLSKTLKKKAKRGIDVGETALDAAKTVVAAVLVKKATEWIKQLT